MMHCFRGTAITVGGYALFQRALPSENSFQGVMLMETYALVILVLIFATGYILSIKK